MENVSLIFVPSNETSEVLEPAEAPLHLPSTSVTSEFSTVLLGRLDSVAAMRTNQVDATTSKSGTKRVAVGCSVINQSMRFSTNDTLFEQRLDERYFVWTGAGRVCSKRESIAVSEDQYFGPFAPLGLANAFTPFFAGANDASAKDSSWCTFPCRSSARTRRAQAFSQMPAFVHAFMRRQHVDLDGKRAGKSFQRAPVRRIQIMPSTQARGVTSGRPPRGDGSGWGKRSAIRCHCSSVSSNSGSVLDPTLGTVVPFWDRLRIGELLSLTNTEPEAQWFRSKTRF